MDPAVPRHPIRDITGREATYEEVLEALAGPPEADPADDRPAFPDEEDD